MFDSRSAGLLPAPTRWQMAGPLLQAPELPRGARGRGAACSALLHVMAVLLAGHLLCRSLPIPPETGLPLTMVFAPLPAGPVRQSMPQPSVKAVETPAGQAAPAHAPAAEAQPAAPPAWPQAIRRPRRARAAQVEAVTAGSASPASPGAPAAPARQPAPSPAPEPLPDPAALAGFTRQVQSAVQAAAQYPPAARRTRVQGRVQVRFDFSQGGVSAIAVAVPGPSPMLDRAALAAVRTAAYPQAPASWRKARLPMVVWVDFHLQTDG